MNLSVELTPSGILIIQKPITRNMTEVTAAVFGGAASIVVNFGSVWYQNHKRKQREKVTEKKEWYRDLLQECRTLERTAYRIEPTIDVSVGKNGLESDDPVIDQIDGILDEIEGLGDRRPESINQSGVTEQISEIGIWHKRNQKESISAIDVKQKIIDIAREMKAEAKEDIPE